MTAVSWVHRAGMVGAAAGAVAAGAAVGLVTQRHAAGRRMRGGPPVPAGGLHPAGAERVVVTEDGVPLHVEVDDPAAGRGSALTVVLVHGWSLTLDSWIYQRPELAALGRVVLYDQRGHGRSGRGDREHSTIDQLGRDLARVIAEVAPAGPVVLVGHSMGGMTIMALADQRPELFGSRVVGVALFSTSPGSLAGVTLGIPAGTAQLLRRVAPALFDQLSRRPALVARGRAVASDLELMLTRHYSFASDVPPALVRFVSQMIASTPLTTIADFYGAFESHDKLAALDALNHVETLVLVGESDLLTPADHSREVFRRVPGGRLVVVPAAGHLVMLEHPETVNAHLRSFLLRAGRDIAQVPG
jgi:pimeloyl-ACP methyl ester carboxylesterase